MIRKEGKGDQKAGFKHTWHIAVVVLAAKAKGNELISYDLQIVLQNKL